MAYKSNYRYGGELRHARTKGSKNGVSNTPGYKAIGKKAIGIRLPDGTYQYVDPQHASNNYKIQQQQLQQKTADARADRFLGTKMGQNVMPKDMVFYRTMDQKGVYNPKSNNPNYNPKMYVNDGQSNRRRQEFNKSKRALSRQNEAMALAEQERQRNSGIGGFFRKATNALGGVAGNVGKALASATGNIRTTMRKTGDTVGNWLNERRRDLGNLWDGSAGAGSAKDKANAARENAKIYRENARRDLKSGNKKRGLAYAKANREQWEEANRQQEAYDNSIVGRLDKAGRDVGNWLNGRRRDAEGVANRARNAVGDAARNARNAIGNAWDGKAGAGTGRDEAERLNARADVKGRLAAGNMKAGRTGRYRELARESISNRAEADRKQQAYDRSIVGRAEKIGKNVSKAANDASTFLNNRVGDARSALKSAKTTATQRIGELRNTISSLPGNVQKRAESIIKDIKSGKTAAEIQAKEIELENLVRNTVTGGSRMPSDDYLDKIDPPKKKKK